MQLRCRKGQRTCCGISLRKGSIATAATTVTVTTTVEIQPSSDSQDSFLKDGMNMSGKVAMTPTITENVKELSPPISAAQALVTLKTRACRIYLLSDEKLFPAANQPHGWMYSSRTTGVNNRCLGGQLTRDPDYLLQLAPDHN